ncbi:MAG: CehA/McbA family metallohydrolase [Candidatus Omnitrophica bacterium]|nr:CehA/McbA family metallohydrolase [Candidatus Omnitrophota bacterium]
MSEYEPLSLAPFCNVDSSILPPGQSLPNGPQDYYGLPFFIGDGQGRVAGFGDTIRMDRITIPVSAVVRHMVFAHRLLDSVIYQGGTPVGQPCADYVFVLEDGSEDRVPIRDRFELTVIPTMWGQLPMLALPETKNSIYPRYEGSFAGAGYRECDFNQAYPNNFYLWYWTNPNPDVGLCEIRVEPTGPRFYIGGITQSFLAELPMTRECRKAIKITLAPGDQTLLGNLDITVDRGVNTYPYSLPTQSLQAYLQSTYKGWGEPMNPNASPSYVEIAANPSATVTVKHEETSLGDFNWGELENEGSIDTPSGMKVELVSPGRNWVQTKVVDADTGQPVPCRLNFRTPEAVPFQPHGHPQHVFSNLTNWNLDVGGDLRLGNNSYGYTDGTCQGWLPRGEVVVDIAQGYEYQPVRKVIQIAPGQQELTLEIQRMTNMSAERYFSGDTHVHFLSTSGGHLEAAGEGLNVVNLLQAQWGASFSNYEDFIARPSVDQQKETIVYTSQENRQHLLGHLSLLGLKDRVMPWGTDGPGEAFMGGNLETTLCHWADACRAAGGTVIMPHFPLPNVEPPALIATDRAHAVEFLSFSYYGHSEYYRYLNCGYKLPLVGGTDKMDSQTPVGMFRTYVYVPEDEEFNYDNWIKNLRLGRTFISSGPLISFTVEGEPIGSTIDLPPSGGTVEVQASVKSIFPVGCLQIVVNGEVVEQVEENPPVTEINLNTQVNVSKHSWITARSAGPNYSYIPTYDGGQRGIMGHTSPIYLAVGGDWTMFDLATANYMLTLCGGGIEYIRTRAHQWPEGTVTHHHGNHDHQEFLEAPFQEAIRAIHRRMHDLGIPH